MPENIIDLDAHRHKRQDPSETAIMFEQMAMIEDALEILDELGVNNRDELVSLLEQLEQTAQETTE